MKYLISLCLLIFSNVVTAKTGYENIITFNSTNWNYQKTPTGLALICVKCENQVMVSADIVPINKSNKNTKSNADFISFLMVDKDAFAKNMAKDAALGGKVKLIKAGKSKIDGTEVFRYMFIVNIGGSESFDNTSLFLHKNQVVKITLNYFNGYFSAKDKAQVDSLFKSIKLTP